MWVGGAGDGNESSVNVPHYIVSILEPCEYFAFL